MDDPKCDRALSMSELDKMQYRRDAAIIVWDKAWG